MNIRITETKEIDADLSEKSLDEIQDLFTDFIDEIGGQLSDKKYKKFLKFAINQARNYLDTLDLG